MGFPQLSLANRYLQTLKYLRLRQILWRPYLHLRRRAYAKSGFLRARLRSVARSTAAQLPLRVPGPFVGPGSVPQLKAVEHLRIARSAEVQEFTFLNQTVQFPGEIDWHAASLSHLWRYNLQYHAYLVSLGVAFAIEKRTQSYQAFKNIIVHWHAHNPLPSGDAWHPYPVSLRIVNWIMAATLFEQALSADQGFSEELREHLVEQLLYLSRNLEHDVGGNHLMENIKALCVGGAYFCGEVAEGWLELGIRLLQTELDRQVLADGGHYERSPMYHAIVLEDLVVIGAALKNVGRAWPTGFAERLERMAEFHSAFLHPDNEISLLNDSAFGIAPDPQELIDITGRLLGRTPRKHTVDAKYGLLGPVDASGIAVQGEPRDGLTAFPDSGYFVVRRGANAWFIDAGAVCPDDLPAHAHSDIFSYELSVNGARWIVDSGVKEYTAGAWRDFARATQAHNTVAVNKENQVDVWSSFRVGRRVKPRNVRWTVQDSISIIAGRHYGFGDDQAHTRVFVDINSEAWLVLDEVEGNHVASVESYIHLHPSVEVNHVGDQATLHNGEQTLRLVMTGFTAVDLVVGQTEPIQGWYMPQFGVAYPRATFVCRTDALPSLTAYLVTGRADVDDLTFHADGQGRFCKFRFGGEQIEVCWNSATLKPTVRRMQL